MQKNSAGYYTTLYVRSEFPLITDLTFTISAGSQTTLYIELDPVSVKRERYWIAQSIWMKIYSLQKLPDLV